MSEVEMVAEALLRPATDSIVLTHKLDLSLLNKTPILKMKFSNNNRHISNSNSNN